jgi:MFS family permease
LRHGLNSPVTMKPESKFYYGYAIVAASTIIMTAGVGIYYSYSVFFESLLTEFGWSRAVTSGAFSVSILVAGLLGIVMGRISDRVGPKAICIFSGIVLGLGFILMSRVDSPWQVFAIHILLLASGVSGLWPAVVSSVPRWFIEKRGLMTGIVTGGIGLGGFIFPPVISHFVSVYGWRTAYVLSGVIIMVVVVAGALFLKYKPIQASPAPKSPAASARTLPPGGNDFTLKEVLLTRQFWVLVVVFILLGFNQFSITVHMVPYASGVGISPLAAAGVLSSIGGASIVGRVLIGVVGDRLRIKTLFIFIIVLFLVSLAWLEFADKLWSIYLFAIVFGFAYGGSSTIQPLLAVDLFGISALGILLGILGFSVFVGGSIGPVISGYIFDVTGSYHIAFIVNALIAVAALVLTLSLTRPRKKKDPR